MDNDTAELFYEARRHSRLTGEAVEEQKYDRAVIASQLGIMYATLALTRQLDRVIDVLGEIADSGQNNDS